MQFPLGCLLAFHRTPIGTIYNMNSFRVPIGFLGQQAKGRLMRLVIGAYGDADGPLAAVF